MNLKPFVIFFIALVFLSIPSFAQKTEIDGTVLAAKDESPLPHVMVLLNFKGENTVKNFTMTTNDGTFRMSIPDMNKEYELKFRLMGYASKTIELTSQLHNIKVSLEEKAVKIKEVAIKAPKIRQRGDTISYMVASFARAEDKTIGDVLKKMPGIEVDKDGKIKYNGRPINKFYVEGLDLLEGRYGIATNGIPQQDVSQVQVLENHQPIKALEDFSFSDDAAINIKLKNGAKSKWIGTARLGSGFSPFLWNAELLGMRFAPRSQSMNTYKTNNMGKDVIGETRSYNLKDILPSDDRYKPADYIHVTAPSTTDIDADRLRFNTSHVVTSTNLWKLGKDYELKGQVVYANNRLTNNSLFRTTYFTPQDTFSVEEDNAASTQQNKVALGTILTANTEKIYLKNKLTADLNWNSIHSTIQGTYPSAQKAELPGTKVTNDFELISRSGKHAISIESYNTFYEKNHSLVVWQNGQTNRQQLNNSGFFSNTSTAYSLNFKAWTLSLNGGLSLLTRRIENHLQGGTLPQSVPTTLYSSTFSYLHPYIKPVLEYKNKSWVGTLKLPVHYYDYAYDYGDVTNNHEQYYFSPALTLRYYTTPKLMLYVSGNLHESPVPDQYFFRGIILQNYRNLQQGYTNFDNEKSKSLSGGFKYKDPIKMFFANASVYRTWNTIPRIPERDFVGDYIWHSFVNQSKDNNLWQAFGRLSKGMDWLNGLFNLSVSYSSVESALYQGGTNIPFALQQLALAPGITTRLSSWSNAEYTFNYTHFTFRTESSGTDLKNYQMQHEMKLNFTPKKRWRVNVTGEYYINEVASNQVKNLFLMDSGIFYTLKNGMELSLSVMNLFDERNYAFTINNDLSSTYSQYEIRPRNVLLSLYFKF